MHTAMWQSERAACCIAMQGPSPSRSPTRMDSSGFSSVRYFSSSSNSVSDWPLHHACDKA
jgi:hypothetical protein